MTTLLDIQGRRTIGYLTNKSGGSVAKGDVVVLDSANDEAFKTSTAGAEVIGVGVVVEENGIANNAQGRVAFQGYVSLVNVNASVTRGNFGKTHTVAKQAVDAGSSRVLGVFCQFLTSGTTPTAMLFGQPDGVTGAGGLSGGTPALTFSTSNSAGAAASGIRTDATIALFDATAPVTQAFADAAAAGSAGVAARRDHKHGMPASPIGAYAEVIYTAGDITLGSGTSMVVLSGPGDCVVAAATGDRLFVGLSARTTDTDADSLSMDAATIVSAAPVNFVSSRTGTAHTTGVPGWYFGVSRVEAAGAVVPYIVQAGDISGGNVTLRLYYRVSGVGKVLAASSTIPLMFWVQNLKQ